VRELGDQLRALSIMNTEAVRSVRREFSRRLAAASAKTVIEIALRVLDEKSPMGRFIAYELVNCHRAARTQVTTRHVQSLGRGIDSWGAADCFACYVAGPAWREGQVPDRVIERWAKSPDQWWRRAALVSTVPLNSKARGGSGDVARTLEICRRLVGDRNDMVVKAMSWALRELAKRDPKSVRWFLNEYDGQLAARVQREVRNKLATGLKNPRKDRG
jgi:3-methyladenine DNA glycosylase AlkD